MKKEKISISKNFPFFLPNNKKFWTHSASHNRLFLAPACGEEAHARLLDLGGERNTSMVSKHHVVRLLVLGACGCFHTGHAAASPRRPRHRRSLRGRTAAASHACHPADRHCSCADGTTAPRAGYPEHPAATAAALPAGLPLLTCVPR